jgi:hypothetical protein
MKKAITIGLAAVALAVPLTYVIAASRYAEPAAPADTRPAYALFDKLRALALEPQGQPIRRGPYHVLHATDARGRTLRVVADAELGDIISIAPVHAPGWAAQAGPRIIHIPDPNEVRGARLEQDWPDEVPADLDDMEEARPLAPRPPRQVRPVRPAQRKADIPPVKHESAPRRSLGSAPAAKPEPPAAERRNLISAPPPEARAPAVDSEGLSPVYPTPRFNPPDDKLMPPPGSPKAEPPAETPAATAPGASGPAEQ